MSILIEGIEIPDNCFDCPFMYCRKYCLVNSKIEFNDPEYSELKGRYDGCPLIEVTEPHGRLIDGLEINSRFDNGIKTISKLPFPNDFVELYKQLATEVKEEIGKCHTIIPASKEE